MKKISKIILITLFLLTGLFILFITEESIRLQNKSYDMPIIIIDKVMCSKDDWVCYGKDGKYTEQYWSLGFSLKKEYHLDENSSEDNHMYRLVGEEFLLFNKFRLWAWTT